VAQSESGKGHSLKARLGDFVVPLARQPFRLLWAGQSVSVAGDALTQIASVFAIIRIGGSAADIGYVAAVQTVARVAFILLGGVWADRLPRRFVMLTSDLLRAVVQGSLAFLLFTGTARVWELGVGAAFYGAAQAFFGPASTGVVPETVPATELQAANSLMGFSQNFFQIGGPAAAGVLVAAFGPGFVFAADAVSFLVSAVSLARLQLPPRKMPPRSSLWSDLATGWREMAIRPWYWLTLIAHALWNFAIPVLWVLGPVIAARSLGGASAWGAIAASWSAGSVIGAIVALRFKPRRPLVAANLALVLTALPVLALVPPLPVWAIAAADGVGGLGLMLLNTLWISTMQQLIPDQVRSRVDSYDWLISLAVMPTGYAIVGLVAARFGDPVTLIVGALLLGVPGALAAVLIPGIRAVRRTKDGIIVGPPPRAGGQPVPAMENP
jgi:Transmembrane secretion effector